MNGSTALSIPAAILLACSACARASETTPAAGPDAPPAAAQQRPAAESDVRFMQQMIVHHAQALEMTAIAAQRAADEQIRLLARRIERSQDDEMARMRTWLRSRGAALPAEHAHHSDHGGMPGMATPEELARLRTATGAEFDRLFLELMIRHHEGALTMVEQLFATPGGVRDPELYQFASHIDADQRMEIARMRRLLQ